MQPVRARRENTFPFDVNSLLARPPVDEFATARARRQAINAPLEQDDDDENFESAQSIQPTQPVQKLQRAKPVVADKEAQPKLDSVEDVKAGELLVNFSKGSIDLYSKGAMKTLAPVIFLINNAISIAKGFAHLAIPLMMTYILMTHVPQVTNLLLAAPRAMQMGYAVCFYMASAFVWVSTWMSARYLVSATKRGFFRVASVGQNLRK